MSDERVQLCELSKPDSVQLITTRQSGALDELGVAFQEWAEDHGPIWFDNEARLRDELAVVLGIELVVR